MSKFKGCRSYSLEDILNSVSEFDILAHYLNITSIPCLIKSPFRQDNNPSFGLKFKDSSNSILYKDFGSKDFGDTFNLLGRLWNMSYTETIHKIGEDLNIIINNTKDNTASIHQNNKKRIRSPSATLKCKVRGWRPYDIEYWESYGISLDWLQFGDIYPISYIIINKYNKIYNIPADKYAYAYVEFKDNKESLKIYQPFNLTHKWSNKHDSSVWDLWTKLPKVGDVLIITSSRKDALCIWENTGVPACSLQAESYLPKPHVVKQLKDRFKKVYVLYDNDYKSIDNPGRKFGRSIAESYNLTQIEIPEELQVKDTSDLCKKYGRSKVKQIILNLIKNNNND